jgi:hypothetical protein
MLAVGLLAALFIKACIYIKVASPPPNPPEINVELKEQAAPAPDNSKDMKVDRSEVEKGQPLPRNYVE